MAFKILDAGNITRTIATMRVVEPGTLRRIIRMKVLDTDGTTLRTVATFAPPLSVTAPSAVGTGEGGGHPVSITSSPTTATPAGGLGPYSYAWSPSSSGGITVDSPTSPTTTFTGTVPSGGVLDALFGVTVTDSSGQTATASVSVSLVSFS